MARYTELEELLCQPNVLSDQTQFRLLSKERADLAQLQERYTEYLGLESELRDNKEALSDPELKELAQDEIPGLEERLENLVSEIQLLLLPRDPNDARNTILEIRSGTGGEEAALFAADLFRMYARFADQQKWGFEVMSTSEASGGGLKEIVALISGKDVFSWLRFEGGVHRVQRVPATESQGRIHTSTATVAVLPEADDVDIDIRDEDLQVTIARSGGPGGQGVNTTDSAVQIIHKPTGIMVKCQDERSQIKNRAKAMKILRARILEQEQRAQDDAISAERKNMVGTGERSEKIRTYNYPQNRITDHRIQVTLHKLDAVVEGDLNELISALRTSHQAELLKLSQSDL